MNAFRIHLELHFDYHTIPMHLSVCTMNFTIDKYLEDLERCYGFFGHYLYYITVTDSLKNCETGVKMINKQAKISESKLLQYAN